MKVNMSTDDGARNRVNGEINEDGQHNLVREVLPLSSINYAVKCAGNAVRSRGLVTLTVRLLLRERPLSPTDLLSTYKWRSLA